MQPLTACVAFQIFFPLYIISQGLEHFLLKALDFSCEKKFTESSRKVYETSTKSVRGDCQIKEVKIKKTLLYLQTQNNLSVKN